MGELPWEVLGPEVGGERVVPEVPLEDGDGCVTVVPVFGL